MLNNSKTFIILQLKLSNIINSLKEKNIHSALIINYLIKEVILFNKFKNLHNNNSNNNKFNLSLHFINNNNSSNNNNNNRIFKSNQIFPILMKESP